MKFLFNVTGLFTLTDLDLALVISIKKPPLLQAILRNLIDDEENQDLHKLKNLFQQ